MNKAININLLFFIILFLGVACTNSHTKEGHQDEGQHHAEHLLEKIRQYQDEINYEVPNTAELDSSALLAVHADLPGVKDFFTEKRTLTITSFPCTNCHSQSLARLKANSSANIQNAHWDIHLLHAGENTMNCTTCHGKDNMDQLSSLTGELIMMDESFKLCGQCHSTQYKDWQGGAHGKQLNGWKPPRVARTCVSCHNPHQPAFPKRFPARLNTRTLGE